MDVEPLPKDRLLAFYSTIGSAEPVEGRVFEILRNEMGQPTVAFNERGVPGSTFTVSLLPVIEAALVKITEGDS